MPDETPPPAPGPQGPAQPASAPTQEGTSFNIGEEFGTAKRNLPPAKIVLIGVAVVAVVALFVSFLQRAKPQGDGQIDSIAIAEVPEQNMTLVAAGVTVRNTGKKALWIHSIQGRLKTESEEFNDSSPVSAVDYERYFQAFPALKEHAEPALLAETKISIGGEARGMVLVSFPVNQNAFDKRKSFSVVIQPYDQPAPIVLTK
jgi:hypothetical protein